MKAMRPKLQRRSTLDAQFFCIKHTPSFFCFFCFFYPEPTQSPRYLQRTCHAHVTAIGRDADQAPDCKIGIRCGVAAMRPILRSQLEKHPSRLAAGTVGKL